MSDRLPDGMEPLPPERQAEIAQNIKRIPRFMELYPPPWALGLAQDGEGFVFVDRNHVPLPIVLPMRFLVFGLTVIFGVNHIPATVPRQAVFPPKSVLRSRVEGVPQTRDEWRLLASEVFSETGALPGEDAWYAWVKEHKFLDLETLSKHGRATTPAPSAHSDEMERTSPNLSLDMGTLLTHLGIGGSPVDDDAKEQA